MIFLAAGSQAQTEEQRRRESRESTGEAARSSAKEQRSGTTHESPSGIGSAMPETGGRLFVRKSDGSMESFSTEKLARSLVGAGANRDDAEDIAESVRQRVRPGITTADIADIVLDELSGRDSSVMKNYVAWQTSHQTAPQKRRKVT